LQQVRLLLGVLLVVKRFLLMRGWKKLLLSQKVREVLTLRLLPSHPNTLVLVMQMIPQEIVLRKMLKKKARE